MKPSTSRKILSTLLVLSLMAAVTGGVTVSAFSATSQSNGNTFAAGTVGISDNDGGSSALYNVSGLEPGQGVEKCIKVTYGGTLAGEVRIYTDSSIGALGSQVGVQITPGTQTGSPAFPSCAGFTPDAGGHLFDGTLASFASTHGAWGSGVPDDGPAAATSWTTADAVVYRLRVTVADDDSATNKTTGSHRFVFEGRNE
jgi:predicted ribosomally synthesized peptide with SipW-like signal peptide